MINSTKNFKNVYSGVDTPERVIEIKTLFILKGKPENNDLITGF